MKKTGVELISDEREKQIVKHGFTGEHHFNHPEWYNQDQLIQAANTLSAKEIEICKLPLNWDFEWFRNLTKRSYHERLIIAGALIAAELDRLNFNK